MRPFRRFSRAAAVLCLCVLLASGLWPGAAGACIWPYQEPAYWMEFQDGPERDQLLGGQIGILDSSWSKAGLFVAWRQFEGLGIPKEDWRAFWTGDTYYPEGEEAADGGEAKPAPAPTGISAWQAALVRALGSEEATWPAVSPEIGTDVPDPVEGTRWVYFLNCLEPAFDAAAAALDQRMARWGKDSKEFQEWLRGQRKVFANCSEIGENPPELDAGWPADLRADRQYQIAAADFYALRYEAAAARFRRIAADKSSPWAKVAAFAVARCTLRRDQFAQAADEFRAILADKNLAEYHDSAARLIRFAEERAAPELAAAKLEKEARAKEFEDPLGLVYDLVWLSKKLDPSPDRPLLYFLRSVSESVIPATEVYAHWQQKPSPASLVVAMSRALGSASGLDAVQHAEGTPILGKPESEALVAAAAKIPKGSAAYLSARYYRTALLSGVLGRPDEARKELDQLIAEKVGDRAAVQRLRHDRAHLARDWNELVEYGLLTPLGETDEVRSAVLDLGDIANYNPELAKDPRLFIPVAQDAVNRFASLAELAQLQQNAGIPERLRRELAQAGFLRAALQGQDAEAAAFADAGAKLDPKLGELVAEWRAAPDPDRKKFTAALVALRHPGLSIDLSPDWGRSTPLAEIDDLRENWWCAITELPAIRPAFLEGKEAPADAAFGWHAGPNQLGQEVLAYAKKYPDDPRLPEALHLTVRATRFGCYGEPFLETSKAAFNLLHKRFPKNDWTAKTPYYFE